MSDRVPTVRRSQTTAARWPALVGWTLLAAAVVLEIAALPLSLAVNGRISLREEERQPVFEGRDDGVGFDQSVTGHGTGLRGMIDRIEAIGGELRITSAPGQGTTVGGILPITATGTPA